MTRTGTLAAAVIVLTVVLCAVGAVVASGLVSAVASHIIR